MLSLGKIFFVAALGTIAVLFSACQQENDPRCALEPEAGDCYAAIPKYYFNPTTKQCEEFTWGGCGGVVPFETMLDCQLCGCQ